MPAVERTNQSWMTDLTAGSHTSATAQSDLLQLIRRGLTKILGRNKSIDHDTLDDFTQEAVVRILKNLDTFRGDSRFTTWAMAIAVRVAFTHLRSAQWRRRPVPVSSQDQDRHADFTARDHPPEDLLQRKMIVDMMYRVIREKLTPRQSQALLAELNGEPQAVIAQRLGIKRNALYKLTHDARKRLKQEISAAGVTEAEVRDSFGL